MRWRQPRNRFGAGARYTKRLENAKAQRCELRAQGLARAAKRQCGVEELAADGVLGAEFVEFYPDPIGGTEVFPQRGVIGGDIVNTLDCLTESVLVIHAGLR